MCIYIYTYQLIHTYIHIYIYMSDQQNHCNTNLVFDSPWPFRGFTEPS